MRQGHRDDNGGDRRVVREDGTMEAGGGPTVPARRVGKELRRLREAAGMTQAEVAQYVGTYSTTITKIEKGERNAPLPHLKLMLQAYEVSAEHAEILTRLVEQAREPGWWSHHGDDVLPKWFIEYVSLESEADKLWVFEQGYVPGLLQTRRYTEAIAAAANAAEISESAEGFARVRATRQQRLVGNAPLTLRVVMDESILHRTVGGPDVMREQVARLREAMTQPNITIQILPFAVGIHPGLTGSFTLLRFSQRAMDMVYVEQRGGAFYLDRPKDIDLHEATFEQLSAFALSDDKTASLLMKMERGY